MLEKVTKKQKSKKVKITIEHNLQNLNFGMKKIPISKKYIFGNAIVDFKGIFNKILNVTNVRKINQNL